MSLDQHPVSTLRTKVQSSASWFPSDVYHAYNIKNHCAAVGNCCAGFFATCAAAQPRCLEGTLPTGLTGGKSEKAAARLNNFRRLWLLVRALMFQQVRLLLLLMLMVGEDGGQMANISNGCPQRLHFADTSIRTGAWGTDVTSCRGRSHERCWNTMTKTLETFIHTSRTHTHTHTHTSRTSQLHFAWSMHAVLTGRGRNA